MEEWYESFLVWMCHSDGLKWSLCIISPDLSSPATDTATGDSGGAAEECPLCQLPLGSVECFDSHIERDGAVYKCWVCDCRTRHKSKMSTHLRNHTRKKPYSCPHCLYRAASGSNISSHIRHVHGGLCHLSTHQYQRVAHNLLIVCLWPASLSLSTLLILQTYRPDSLSLTSLSLALFTPPHPYTPYLRSPYLHSPYLHSPYLHSPYLHFPYLHSPPRPCTTSIYASSNS